MVLAWVRVDWTLSSKVMEEPLRLDRYGWQWARTLLKLKSITPRAGPVGSARLSGHCLYLELWGSALAGGVICWLLLFTSSICLAGPTKQAQLHLGQPWDLGLFDLPRT